MNTWQMIRELTEAKKEFGKLFYGAVDEDEGIKICYLRPYAGSIEFRYYDFIREKLIMNPILYNEENWEQLTEKEAVRYLGRHIDSVLVEE